VGVIVTSILSIVLANTISLTEIAIIGSAGFLLIFFIVNIAAYKMRERIYARGGVLLLGIVLSGSALVTLLYHTYSTDLRAIIVFFSFIIVSIVFEFFYGRYVRGQFFERQY
jgi:hypothetical protein